MANVKAEKPNDIKKVKEYLKNRMKTNPFAGFLFDRLERDSPDQEKYNIINQYLHPNVLNKLFKKETAIEKDKIN
jgi:hypothetical protein